MHITATPTLSGGETESSVRSRPEHPSRSSRTCSGIPILVQAAPGPSSLTEHQPPATNLRWRTTSSTTCVLFVEQALKAGNDGSWPLITLNLDLKTEEPAHLAAILSVLQSHRDWITTAPRAADISHKQKSPRTLILNLQGFHTRRCDIWDQI